METLPTLDEIRDTWPATVGVPQGATALGISKAHFYQLIREGQSPVKVLSFGNRHRVVTASLVKLLEGA